jgi:hypothetical protein
MKKTILLLVGIMLVYVISAWLRLEYVMTIDNIAVMYEDLLENNKNVTAENLYEQTHQYTLVTLIITALSALVKLLFFTLVVYVGYYLFAKQSFLDILKSTVVAESVNVLLSLVAVVNLIWFNPPTSQLDVAVAPFSLASFFDINKLDQWMVTPLSAMNIFEVLYIVVLSYMLSRNLKQTFGTSCKIVLCSYGVVTLLLIIGSTALTLYATR